MINEKNYKIEITDREAVDRFDKITAYVLGDIRL